MTIEIKRNAQATVIELTGRLDTTTAPALDKTVNEDVADAKNLVFDFKRLEYVSSAGLRVLLASQKKMNQLPESLLLLWALIPSLRVLFS